MEIVIEIVQLLMGSLLQSDQNAGSLKEELRKILPQLEEMRKRKSERRNQFMDVLEEIRSISNEIQGSLEYVPPNKVDETDLSLRKLEELHKQLHALQQEKVFFFLSYSRHDLSVFLYNLLTFGLFTYAERSVEAGSGPPLCIKLTLPSSWYGFQAYNK